MSARVRARAPGRVNLIGDHTDYSGGLALPLATDLETVVTVEWNDSRRMLFTSDNQSDPAVVAVPVAPGFSGIRPPWARFVAGAAEALGVARGCVGTVTSNVPVEAGLSSSAALEVALALALGFDGSPLDLALTCRSVEETAVGVPCGLMDQLTAVSGVDRSALLIDFSSLEITPVEVPEEFDVVVVHSGTPRQLACSPYAERHSECSAAESLVGPLANATLDQVESLGDQTLKRRARHVVSENSRVRQLAAALPARDRDSINDAMSASHQSLARDFGVSTPELDATVRLLESMPGVIGARLTGAGFGGCVVALTEAGALDPGRISAPAWVVRPSRGASLEPAG